ncbi:MAG TPA: GntR family transcriptional regulator [Sphingobium sp.]|nr:GntR family transcriptional regulator [Sphingobium sp.]
MVDEVYNAILDRLTCLDIAPGSKIVVDSLAREIGVSQTPVREALGRLEADGLVTKSHLIGHRASPQLTRRQVEQLFEIRLLLEPAGAGAAAVLMTEPVLDELHRLNAEMAALRDNAQHAYGEFARKDAEFHAVLAQASGNGFLADALDRLHTHIHIFRLVRNSRITSEAIDEHEAILAGLNARDQNAAFEAMQHHIICSRDRILPMVSE